MFKRLIQSVPHLEGALAFRRFCTPRLSRYRSEDHDVLAARARVHLRDALNSRVPTSVGDITTYVLEPADTTPIASVLLVHGWTGEASFMSAFGEYLRRRGYRAVLMDMPAHGNSARKHTNLISCAHAVREVAEALGPIHFVLAHSMGGLAALLAGAGGPPLPKPYPFEAFVLVAIPNLYSDITATFCDERGLTTYGQQNFQRRLERIACRKLSEFTGARLLRETGRPALLMHARDDADIPFSDAQAIAAAYTGAELLAYDGLGHRIILYTPDVVRAATQYIDGQAQALGFK